MDLASIENDVEYHRVLSQINALGKCINQSAVNKNRQQYRIHTVCIHFTSGLLCR